MYFNTFVHDCQAKSVHWSEMTKHLAETILSLDSKDFELVTVKDLDSITKYNGKVDDLCRNGPLVDRGSRAQGNLEQPTLESLTPGVHGLAVLQTQGHGQGDGGDGLPRSVQHT